MVTLLLLLGCMHRPRAIDPHAAALGEADDCAAFADWELRHELDEKTRSVAREGNRAELLINGASAWPRREANAADAELILVKTFIYSDDEAGRAVAALLKARAQAGAIVVVQYDLKGSLGGWDELSAMRSAASGGEFLGNKPILADMAAAGVIVVPTNVPRRSGQVERWLEAREGEIDERLLQRRWDLRNFDHFDHEKYWITGHRLPDGSLELRAILGGMNIASEYAYGGTTRVDEGTGRGGWRDTDVEVRGPVVNDIVDRYLDVLDHNLAAPLSPAQRDAWNPPQPAMGSARVRFVWNQPALGNRRSIERLYRALVEATPPGSVIRVQSAYFAPGPRFMGVFRAALRKERRLAVLTNSAESIDVGLIPAATRYQFRQLMKTAPGVALYEWHHRPDAGEATLHTKAASFGRCGPVILGSANLDGLSSEHNSESVVVIEDSAFRHEFDAMFELDIGADAARYLTWEDVQERSPLGRLGQWGVYRLGWYWLSAP